MLTTLIPPTSGIAERRRPRRGDRVSARSGARSGTSARATAPGTSSAAATSWSARAGATGCPARGPPASRRADRRARPHGGRGPQGLDPLRRPAPPARHRDGARPPAASCCSSTSRRPASTRRTGPTCRSRSARLHEETGTHDRPHHPLPRRGRRPRRPGDRGRPRPGHRRRQRRPAQVRARRPGHPRLRADRRTPCARPSGPPPASTTRRTSIATVTLRDHPRQRWRRGSRPSWSRTWRAAGTPVRQIEVRGRRSTTCS